MTVPPIPFSPIVGNNGVMSQEFRTWTQLITNETLLIGTGSPEGVVEAIQGRIYMDDAGTAGNILYIKRDADIGGDTSQGWILV